MAQRTKHGDWPTNVPGTLKALKACRDAMIEVHKCVKPMGAVYHGAAMVISAIDALATLLTGQRYYFSAEFGPSATTLPRPHDPPPDGSA